MRSMETDARAVALASRLKAAEEETRAAKETMDALERRASDAERARRDAERENAVLTTRLEEATKTTTANRLSETTNAENGDTSRNVFEKENEDEDEKNVAALREALATTRAALQSALDAGEKSRVLAETNARARDAAVSGADPEVGGVVFAMRRERAALQERLAQAEEERAYFQSALDETQKNALREAAGSGTRTRESLGSDGDETEPRAAALASDEKRRSRLLETSADETTMPSPAGETGNSRVEDGRGARLEAPAARRAREEARTPRRGARRRLRRSRVARATSV